MMLEGLKSLARRSVIRTPVRFSVRAMEKKAMAAVIARRGCSMVWPSERKPWVMRVRKGMTLLEAKTGWIAEGISVGPWLVLGVRRRSLPPRTIGGVARTASLPLVSAMMRSSRDIGGSGRGDFNISIQAAPLWASASMAAQVGQPAMWRSKVAWSAAERVPSSASESIASHCAQCCGLLLPWPGFTLPNWLNSATYITCLSSTSVTGIPFLFYLPSLAFFCRICFLYLSFYTLQKPCKFPAAATDAAFYRSFGNAKNLRYLFVIHILQIAKNNSFAKFRGELFECVLDFDLELKAGDVMFLRGPGVGEAIAHGGAVLFAVEGGVEGIAGAVQASAAKVIHQEITGKGRDPCLEAPLLGVEAGQILVELEEDLLGEVLGIGAGSGETVADGVDAAMLGDDQLLPGRGAACHPLAYQSG